MAGFNFGFIGSAIEAAHHANANIDLGPVNVPNSAFLDIDFGNFVENADRIFTVEGSSEEFVWGQKWGTSTTRVTE